MSDIKELKKILLEIEKIKLNAQLKAIKKMIPEEEIIPVIKHSKSGISIVYDILQEENIPLHINDIIRLAKEKFDIVLDRESIVSAITKKIKRQEKFIRTGKNTFTVLKKEQ